MKIRTLFILMFFGLSSLSGYAQESAMSERNNPNPKPQDQGMRTLFGNDNGKTEHGGWGGFTLGYTRIAGRDAFLSGGRGGWLINHRFTLGGGGYGFYSNFNHDANYQPTLDNYSLGGGYGGLLIEPIIAPFEPVHISVPILIGGGSAFVMNDFYYHGNYHDYDLGYGGFFVFEPGIDIEVNIVKFFRVALNASYRYTSDLSLDYYNINGDYEFTVPSNALRGFNFGVTMKFGKF